MKAKLEDLIIDKVALCQQGANQHAEVAFFKSEELTATDPIIPATDHTEVSVPEDAAVDKAMSPEEMERRMSALEEKMKRMMGDMKKEEPETVETPAVEEETPAVEDVAVEPVVEKSAAEVDLAKANEQVRKELEDARAEIAKMQHEARTAEFIAKAKADFGNIGEAGEVGARLLEAADRMSPEGYQWVERTLKAVNAQLESSDLFKQVGNPNAEPVEAKAKIYELAEKMVADGDAPNVGMALAQVAKQHPELVDEYYSAAERA